MLTHAHRYLLHAALVQSWLQKLIELLMTCWKFIDFDFACALNNLTNPTPIYNPFLLLGGGVWAWDYGGIIKLRKCPTYTMDRVGCLSWIDQGKLHFRHYSYTMAVPLICTATLIGCITPTCGLVVNKAWPSVGTSLAHALNVPSSYNVPDSHNWPCVL